MTVGTGKFISKKVSAVRWQPVVDTSQTCSSTLAAGSWDDETNSVSVWAGASPGGEASLLASADLPGDVTGLEWLSPDTLSVSCSTGQVQLYRLAGLGGLQLLQEWAGLHRPGAGGATALTRHGDSLASGGQDGRINILVASNRTPLKVYDKADSCSITALTFSKTSELVSSNMRGQIKTWDLRTNSQAPGKSESASLQPGHLILNVDHFSDELQPGRSSEMPGHPPHPVPRHDGGGRGRGPGSLGPSLSNTSRHTSLC